MAMVKHGSVTLKHSVAVYRVDYIHIAPLMLNIDQMENWPTGDCRAVSCWNTVHLLDTDE